MLSDPIVALATPPGRSAVALIRLSGRGAFDVAARALRPFHPDPPRTVRRVQVVHPATGAPVDDALAACFRAARSYTGEDLVELSTHGGLLVPAPEGERLREGALLVIAGRPNVGKSSLFNALLGTERAIVTEIPGTTRDAVEAHAVLEGFPFRLVDTAGLRESDDRVERLGIEVSRKYLAAADLVLFCEERGAGSGERYQRESDQFLTRLAAPIVFVRTKIDVEPPSDGPTVHPSLAVSAVTGEGLAELRRKLAEVAFGRLVALGDVEPVVTRARHRGALERALAEVEAFHSARGSGVEAAAAATHLRAAVGALDDLIGVVTPDDVLDRVFASFCVGK